MPSLSSRFLSVFSALFLAVSSLPIRAEALFVTDSRHPVREVSGARVIELDRAARIEMALSAGLPADPDQAANIARERLDDRALQQRLRQAYQGIAEARGLNVTKVPAVIVDRRYVVYGEADVARAVARIETYRSTQP